MQLSLNQLPWYGQIGAFVVISALGVFGVHNFYLSEMGAELAGKQTRLDQLRVDINKGLATARKLPEFQAEVAELEVRLEALRAVLPEEQDYGDLLRRIQTLVTQSNLTVLAFAPQETVIQQLHAEWPITLKLEGTYHNLGHFFDRVSKFPRLINIGNVTIQAKSPPASGATIVTDCTATTFVLLDQGAEAPAPPTPTRPGASPPRPPAATTGR